MNRVTLLILICILHTSRAESEGTEGRDTYNTHPFLSFLKTNVAWEFNPDTVLKYVNITDISRHIVSESASVAKFAIREMFVCPNLSGILIACCFGVLVVSMTLVKCLQSCIDYFVVGIKIILLLCIMSIFLYIDIQASRDVFYDSTHCMRSILFLFFSIWIFKVVCDIIFPRQTHIYVQAPPGATSEPRGRLTQHGVPYSRTVSRS